METSNPLNIIINYIKTQITKLALENNEMVQNFLNNFQEIDQKCAEEKIAMIIKYLQDINYEDFAPIFFKLFEEKNIGIFKKNIKNNPLFKKIERLQQLKKRSQQLKEKMKELANIQDSGKIVNEGHNEIITSEQIGCIVVEQSKSLTEGEEKKNEMSESELPGVEVHTKGDLAIDSEGTKKEILPSEKPGLVTDENNTNMLACEKPLQLSTITKTAENILIESEDKKDTVTMVICASEKPAAQEEEKTIETLSLTNYRDQDSDTAYFQSEKDTITKEILKEKDDFYVTCSSILGAFLGDAMGSFCEFTLRDETNHERIWTDHNVFYLPKGQITDDSEMALSLCYGLMDGKNSREMEEHLVYMYYGLWANSMPFDMGSTTHRALSHIISPDRQSDINMHNTTIYEQAKPKIKKSNFSSLSNGFLMRISPLATWIFFKEKELLRKTFLEEPTYEALLELFSTVKAISQKETKTTHFNPEALCAAAFYLFMILNCLMRNSATQVIHNMKTLVFDPRFKTEDATTFRVFAPILNAFTGSNYVAFYQKEFFSVGGESIGYYLHAIRLSIFYLKHLDQMIKEEGIENTYRKIMSDICNLGGDTDTNCCIVGAVIGPLIGVDNFGKEVNCLISYVNESRYIYSSVNAVYFINFLEETFRKNVNVSSISEGNNERMPYPYNFLKMVMSLLTIPNF